MPTGKEKSLSAFCSLKGPKDFLRCIERRFYPMKLFQNTVQKRFCCDFKKSLAVQKRFYCEFLKSLAVEKSFDPLARSSTQSEMPLASDQIFERAIDEHAFDAFVGALAQFQT